MSTESDLQTMMLTNTALSSIPMHFATDPQSTKLPKITFQKIGETRQNGNDGDAGVATINLQINVIAASLNQAKTIAKAVKSTLAANMAGTFGTTRFAGIFIEAEKDMATTVEAGQEKPTQCTILSVRANVYDPL